MIGTYEFLGKGNELVHVCYICIGSLACLKFGFLFFWKYTHVRFENVTLVI